ncbi:LOW QUALITY PROTEIN: hypothetical protein HZS_425 [Henneguya salminicola]|nr:LOW QUALITY PROTEIN: hypothetical protein HZS_425 [Henneguya salminicola]
MFNVKKDIAKRKAYSVTEKFDAREESQAIVSRELGMSDSTLRGWILGKLKLREYVHNLNESCGLSRKRARTYKDMGLYTGRYTWFVQQQQSGVPLSGLIVSAQAKKFDKD